MKVIAHRGGTAKGLQNSPEGVRLAVRNGADFVELDVRKAAGSGFECAHGWSAASSLGDCLAEIRGGMGLVAHLKGKFEDTDLISLIEELILHVREDEIIVAAHEPGVLRRVGNLFPELRLARFGLLPAITALWARPPWDYCMIHQSVLLRRHVRALQARGYVVVASCVWEFRSRESVRKLGVDGAFVNLRC